MAHLAMEVERSYLQGVKNQELSKSEGLRIGGWRPGSQPESKSSRTRSTHVSKAGEDGFHSSGRE